MFPDISSWNIWVKPLKDGGTKLKGLNCTASKSASCMGSPIKLAILMPSLIIITTIRRHLMLSLSTLYTGEKDFRQFVERSQLNLNRECLLRIYTSGCTSADAVEIARKLKGILPKSKIFGSSTCGVILKGKQFHEATLIVLEQFDNASVETKIMSSAGKSPERFASELAQDCTGRSVSLIHLLFGGHYCHIFRFVEAFNSQAPEVRLAGGVAGNILSLGLSGYVFDDTGCHPDSMICAKIIGSPQVLSEVNNTSEAISPIYTITDSEGCKIHKIDGKPALKWCQEQFGIEDFSEYEDWQLIAENDNLVRFPFILEGHGGAGRFIKYEGGNISLYFSQLEPGIQFRIGYTSPTKCVQESFNTCKSLSRASAESLFCYSCLFRKMYLENCAEWELRPYLESGVCGAFVMGEIGYLNGRNEFLNGACSLVGIAENNAPIFPDFAVFEDLYKIKDDDTKLNSLILRKQSAAMSRENQILLQELLTQQDKAKAQLYIDPITGVKNAIKFAQDNLSGSFNKLCLVQVENSSLIISHYGTEYYHDILRKAIAILRDYAGTHSIISSMSFYTLNESIFFLAAGSQVSDEEFTALCRELYEAFQFMTPGNNADLIVNRYVVVLGQKNMLEKGMAILKNSESLQSHFVVSTPAEGNEGRIERETAILLLLNRVIQNDWVIPYFQGIRNNQTGKIDKFEALIRIRDESGKIYLPAEFLDIAKTYHLYATLSRCMMDKVFKLFNGSAYQVSINLSAHDVCLPELSSFIINRLAQMENGSNFVFEILEDEEFRNMDQLRDFVEKLRSYGAKVAIDDFGSGYSNFLEIVRMEPEYIKIDGSIIRRIDKDEVSRKVLTSIAGLAAQLGSSLVAEFVETAEIQEYMEQMGIAFSQGYYFSIPGPYEKLSPAAENSDSVIPLY